VTGEAVEIVRLGAQGDGIAETAAGTSFVPFALPGERVRVHDDGSTEILSQPSAERRPALCRHFGACGGCVAQHMSDQLYADWKRGILVEAFRQRGLTPEVAPLVRLPPGSRRRAVLTARRDRGGLVLGFHRRRSRELFAVEECPVLQPAIVAKLAALRAIAAVVTGHQTRMTVLATTAGLDVAITAEGARVDPRALAKLGWLAAEHRIARIAVDGEIVAERAAPALTFADVPVVPPPGAFTQAGAEAEAALTALVVKAIGNAKRAADLFCGIGTLTFPLARFAHVLAVDAQQASIGALTAAARQAQGLKPIDARVRDLFREPMSANDLAGLDAIVLDPPHAGAKAQAEQLARTDVASVVYVSCNPATLARDVRVLVDAGYSIEHVVPVDQFLFSADVEAVAVLRRFSLPSPGTKRPTQLA
jgi:23S rRNA (uracil1939-C5)-methyltransferase